MGLQIFNVRSKTYLFRRLRIKGIIRLGVWGKYAYFNVFNNVDRFYVFQQELLHFPNELLANNCRSINGDYVEP